MAKKSKIDEEKIEVFSFKEFLSQCLSHWQWFLVSFLFFMGYGVYYLMSHQNIYERYTQVLIKDEQMANGSNSLTNAFSQLGLVASNTNVNNELISFSSPSVMYEVVKKLELQDNYVLKEGLKGITLYGDNLPVKFSFPEMDSEDNCRFRATLFPDGSMELYKFMTNLDGKWVKYDQIIKVPASTDIVRSPIGQIKIQRLPAYTSMIEEPEILKFGRNGLLYTTEDYSSKLKADLVDKEAEVIELSIKNHNIQKADDILSTVISVYNQNWVEDKNRLAISTSSFIDDRLKVIQQELTTVDDEISNFKSQNKVLDVGATAQATLTENTHLRGMLIDATNQLMMARFLLEYVSDPAHANDVLPNNTGLRTDGLISMVNNYNALLLERDNLIRNSSEKNPVVADYNTQLAGQREAIIRSLIGNVKQIEASIRNMEKNEDLIQSTLSTAPVQAKDLLSAERQQLVKSELYLYLLQKREETELNQAFTAYNTRIITPPTGPLQPVSPKRTLILFVCFVLSLGVPGLFVYFLESMNTKVRSRKDLDSLPVPFAGEIPRVGKKRKIPDYLIPKKKLKKIIDTPLPVVEEGNRNIINEAFRVVRSNLEFMSGKSSGCKVIMLTSFNPGSGKSFIAFNLAMALAIKGKRVLLLDGDLRHGSVSNYISKPSKGLSNILAGNVDDWHKLVTKVDGRENFGVIGVGKTPPNPAELLDNGNLGKLLDEARNEYDFILIDCPPVDIVVDTQIIAPYADRTIFVARAGLLEKSALKEIEALYDSQKYKHMGVILNGTDTKFSRYHTYGNYQSLTE